MWLTAMLNERQYRFVQEYCKDLIATKAYIRAGYSEQGAEQGASRLLSHVEVQAAIERHKSDLAGAARVTAAFVSEKLRQIADSDRAGCCRYCWGIGHQYQWTEREYTRELNATLNAGRPAPDLQGGFGYSKKTEPNPGCPECEGEGLLLKLPADEKDRLKALDLLQKQLGVQTQNVQHSGPGGGPIQMANAEINWLALSDEEIAAFCQPKGTIEGTLEGSDRNYQTPKQLEAASSP